jgi:hypothetical protein
MPKDTNPREISDSERLDYLLKWARESPVRWIVSRDDIDARIREAEEPR